MKDEELLERIINLNYREFGADVGNDLKRIYFLKEQQLDQYKNIIKEVREYTKSHFKEMVADEEAQKLLEILDKVGDTK